jgi:hypothetical protein
MNGAAGQTRSSANLQPIELSSRIFQLCMQHPATLIVAFDRVARNLGARTAGVDGLTVADVEELVGVPRFLDDLRPL